MKNLKLNFLRTASITLLTFPLSVLSQNVTLITTFTNPIATSNAFFGLSAAALNSQSVIIGAPYENTGATNAGVVYLLSTSGALLTTITNPSPAASDFFGMSVSGMGPDRVLIGAPFKDVTFANDGAVFLFRTNGDLLATFVSPNPRQGNNFGNAVVAFGSDLVLIGSVFGHTTALSSPGIAYLFNTNGTLVMTFNNPTPDLDEMFGNSVAPFSSDRVLIGAPHDRTPPMYSGLAYLFSTNGSLLTTFTNPTPAGNDQFGFCVCAAGGDKVLIGARADDTGAFDAGSAYLFSTNGDLLTTFTNPTPSLDDFFGWALAAVGNDKVLIAAPQSTLSDAIAGSAYLFTTNGALLNTISAPTPTPLDTFGKNLVPIDSGRILITAHRDSQSVSNAGAAYLFSIAPFLSIKATTTNTAVISWPSSYVGWSLQQTTDPAAISAWGNVSESIDDDGTYRRCVVPALARERFFRLSGY